MDRIKNIRNACIVVLLIYTLVFLINIKDAYNEIKIAFVGDGIELLGQQVTFIEGSFTIGIYKLASVLFPFIILLLLIISLNSIIGYLQLTKKSASVAIGNSDYLSKSKSTICNNAENTQFPDEKKSTYFNIL